MLIFFMESHGHDDVGDVVGLARHTVVKGLAISLIGLSDGGNFFLQHGNGF